MSIYIPNMEMPSEGWHKVLMVFSNGDVTDYDGNLVGKAIPVPDHGRLIDADAIDISYSDPEVVETLNDAITIIPADYEEFFDCVHNLWSGFKGKETCEAGFLICKEEQCPYYIKTDKGAEK